MSLHKPKYGRYWFQHDSVDGFERLFINLVELDEHALNDIARQLSRQPNLHDANTCGTVLYLHLHVDSDTFKTLPRSERKLIFAQAREQLISSIRRHCPAQERQRIMRTHVDRYAHLSPAFAVTASA